MADLVLAEGEAHAPQVLPFAALLLGDEGYAEVRPVHLLEVFADGEVVLEEADAPLAGLWGLYIAGVAEAAQGCNSVGLLVCLVVGFSLDCLFEGLQFDALVEPEGMRQAELVGQPFFQLRHTVFFQGRADSAPPPAFLFVISKRPNAQLTLSFPYLSYLIDPLHSDLTLSIAIDLLRQVENDLLLDEVLSHVLLLQLLHEGVAVGDLYLHFPDSALQGSDFLFHLLVLVEDAQCLRLEVVQLVIQAPYLIVVVPLGDCDVQLLHHLLGLFLHRLYLALHDRKQLHFVVLQPASDVLIHLADDGVHLLEVGLDGLLRLLERLPMVFNARNIRQKRLSDGVAEESIKRGQTSPPYRRKALLDNRMHNNNKLYCTIIIILAVAQEEARGASSAQVRMAVVIFVDGVLALVDAVQLLLQFVPTVRDVNLDVVDVLGHALDAEVVGVAVWVGRFSALVVDDVLMVSNHLLQLGKGVCVKRVVLVRQRYSFFGLFTGQSLLNQ